MIGEIKNQLGMTSKKKGMNVVQTTEDPTQGGGDSRDGGAKSPGAKN